MTEAWIAADWAASQLGTRSAPDLLVHLFAECQCIAELCVLQRVRASLGEVRGLHGESKSRCM